jgi:hypothetical protein
MWTMSEPVFDASAGNKVSSGSSNSWSHTVGNFSNRILLVWVDTGLGVSGVTFNGVALTQLAVVNYNSNNEHLYLFYLLNPPVGTYTVAVTASGTTYIVGLSESYYNAAQSGSFGTVASNAGSGTASSNTVASTSTSQIIIDGVNNGAASTATPTAGQTKRYQTASSGAAAGDIAATGGNMTLSWSFSSGVWAEISVPLNGIASSLVRHELADGYGGLFQ